MTATIISNSTPFGLLTNNTVANLFAINEAMIRLQAAVAAAATGFSGTAGTEYETGSNFGVVPSATPGTKGADYAYAVANLGTAWSTFWTAALASIEALDNGIQS